MDNEGLEELLLLAILVLVAGRGVFPREKELELKELFPERVDLKFLSKMSVCKVVLVMIPSANIAIPNSNSDSNCNNNIWKE